MSMEFQIVSDLHLEMIWNRNALPDIPRNSPVLALLGDIGYPSKPEYEEFLLKQAERFDRVYVIAGNHEYYSAEYYSTQKQIQQICDKHQNLMFLQERSDVYNGVRVVGSCLWSDIPEDCFQMAGRSMNDYHLCSIEKNGKKQRLSPSDTVSFFRRESLFLEQEIAAAKAANQPVVVFTHHAPLKEHTSHPRFEGDTMNCAFASNMKHLFGYPVKFWGFGHTHYSSDQIVEGTRVVSNQLGYVQGSAFETEFNPGTVFRV